MGSRPHRPFLAGILVFAACLAALPAAGQSVHPIPRQLRPLHVRIAAADAVVVATIGEVAAGRVQLLELTSLVGSVGDRAELKRSPSTPPPVSTGDRVLLFLLGARSPYRSVDTPREMVRLSDSEAEARWSRAVRALDANREDPAVWFELYSGWLESGPGSLQDLAVASLSDPSAPYQPLPGAFYAERADAAWDADRTLETRRASARLAILHAEGASGLALHASECRSDTDPDVIELSAVAAIRHGVALRDAAMLCALGHDHASVRMSAVKAVGRTHEPTGKSVQMRIEQLATGDEQASVREAAQQALARIRR